LTDPLGFEVDGLESRANTSRASNVEGQTTRHAPASRHPNITSPRIGKVPSIRGLRRTEFDRKTATQTWHLCSSVACIGDDLGSSLSSETAREVSLGN
jgi:hypothetical protein